MMKKECDIIYNRIAINGINLIINWIYCFNLVNCM